MSDGIPVPSADWEPYAREVLLPSIKALEARIAGLEIIEIASIGAHALLADAEEVTARVEALCDEWEQVGGSYTDLPSVAVRLRAALDGPGE